MSNEEINIWKDVELVDPVELKEHPKNPRYHPEKAIEKAMNSIRTYGFTSPIIAQKGTNLILAGHVRKKAAIRLGLKNVPVSFVDLDDIQALGYLVADNRVQDETDWEYSILTSILQELKDTGVDITITGYDAIDLEALMMNVSDIEAPEEPTEGVPDFTGDPIIDKPYIIRFSFRPSEFEGVQQILDFMGRKNQRTREYTFEGMELVNKVKELQNEE